MINTSNEYKRYINENRTLYAYVKITLSDSTELNLRNEELLSLNIDDGVSQSNAFTIGAAIINKVSIAIDNTSGEYTDYDFTNALIQVSIGLQLSSTIETLQKGYFIVDTSIITEPIITITALDYMNKFDSDYSESTLNYPATLYEIISDICTRHNVSLATSTFTNYNYVVDIRPVDEALTDREMVSYCSQIAGCFARINNQGALEIKWYDIGAFETSDNIDGGIFDDNTPYASGDSVSGGTFDNNTPYSSGDSVNGGTFLDMNRYHHIYELYQPNVGTDDVIITGVQIKASDTETTTGETYLYGSAGYIVSIENNPLILPGKSQSIATTIGNKIIGMKFRPLSVSTQFDPCREAGDVGYFSDRKGNSYQMLFSNLSGGVQTQQRITCDSETPSKNNSKRYSPETKVIIETRKNTKQQITNYDATVQQFTNLITNGFGLFQTKVTDSSGGVIYYMHDKPTINESVIRWYMTTGGMIEQNKVNGVWVTVSATDNQGNALYNVITARGIVADWIKTGKISSVDNSVWIDLSNNEFNFAEIIKFINNVFTVNTQNFKILPDGSIVIDAATIKGTVEAIWALIGQLRIDETKIYIKDTTIGRMNEIDMNGSSFLIRNVGIDSSGNPLVGGSSSGINFQDGQLYLFHSDENGDYDNNGIQLNGTDLGNITYDIDNLLERVLYIENFLMNKYPDF